MAHRPSPLESHTQPPPRISLNDTLLSSVVSLPDEPHIVYSLHSPTPPSSQDHDHVELARRQLLARCSSSPLLDSLLPSVHITRESPILYVFAITSHDRIGDCRATLDGLHYEGLSASETSSFTPKDLYPCSLACSTQPFPCTTCHNPQSPTSFSPPSSATLLPRIPLRLVYSHFLEAVRARIIDEISQSSKKNPISRPIQRLKGGFLVHPPPILSEWGADWSHHALTRPLIHCDLQIHLSLNRLIIHPIPRQTPYIPLALSLPLPPGTPITLLPYSTPAYYLTSYAGPGSTLTTQFEQSLAGMGVGEWKTCPQLPKQQAVDRIDPTFIIAWIIVQNNQGEDKGVTVIWPMQLCLSFIPGHPKLRQLLDYIPDFPGHLQPSPPHMAPTSPPSMTQIPGHNPLSLTTRPLTRRAYSSPPRDSLRAFRMLTLGNGKGKGINDVAREVGGYVDAVAKEREKERERMKREREIANSPRLAVPRTPGRNQSETRAPGPSATANPVLPQIQSVVGLSQAPQTSQDFYPSPPQSNAAQSVPPTGNVPTSPEVEPTPIADSEPPVDEELPGRVENPPESAQPPSVSFDPNLDTYWAQPQNDEDFMDMGMDFNMGFVDTSGGGGGGYGRINMDFDDAFTEDDFDFFDRPSANASKAVPIPAASIKMEGLTPTAPLGIEMSPPLFADGLHLSGPGPPHQSPWTMGSLGEGFTPRFADYHHTGDVISPTPQLLPPSPGPTSPSHSAPTTPSVRFNRGRDHVTRNGLGGGVFEPIAFDLSHRIADGKYAIGKFALPSPPDEEDRAEPMSFPVTNGWRDRYKAATDHRIGIVRKLIGVKRRSCDQGARETKMSPSWVREHEDWESGIAKMEVEEDTTRDDESEDDDADEDYPIRSKPSTPISSCLPLGPTLLHMHFHHSQLLPLSSPLRPPGAAVAPTNITMAAPPTNVPTPVSPAAMIGAASEKSKSLEAAAYTVAKEVVENTVWADAWRSNVKGKGVKVDGEVWNSDVKAVALLLGSVPGLEGSVNLATLFQPNESRAGSVLQELEPPMLSVGKSDAIIQVLPSALRFWEKLGLGPRGGKKNVTAFALFEDVGEERQSQVGTWLSSVSATYTAMHLGSHRAGTSSSCTKDGLVPLRFDSFRKILGSFVASLPLPSSSLVFYIITPLHTMSLVSPVLRQVFSAVKRTVKTYSEAQIHFQLVPEEVVIGSLDSPSVGHSEIELLCSSLYDRILQPVDRSMSRRFFEHGERTRKYVQEPRFALARPVYSRVKFIREAPIKSLDVVDRYTLLHVGYQISPCGKWVLAACVDQRGEAHELGVWLMQNEGGDGQPFVVNKVWEFLVQFAKRANVEWRIVIAKLGAMSGSDLDAWMSHLANAVPACPEIPMMHVSLLSVEHDVPWTFITPHDTPKPPPLVQTRSSSKESSLFIDISASTCSMYPSIPLPLSSSPTPSFNADMTYIPDPTESHPPPDPPTPPLLPLSSTVLIRTSSSPSCAPTMLLLHVLYTLKSSSSSLSIPDIETHQDITRNYHELAVFSSLRWQLGASGRQDLPFHLAALEVMREALDRGETWCE